MTAAHRVMHRTEVPGIYRRGASFVVVTKRSGRQHKKAFTAMADAMAFKERHIALRDPVAAEVLKRARGARVRTQADLSDAYAFVRQAAQSVDKARTSIRLEREILRALHEAEDLIQEAMKK